MTVVAQGIDSTFAGKLVGPDDPDYDTARQVFNGVFDKRPALIARCTSPADVQLALAHARQPDLVVAVRGGGHSIPGHSSCDDGLVIDTGPMKRVEIARDARTGRFGAGLGIAGLPDVWTMKTDGRDVRRVTFSELWDSGPDWGARQATPRAGCSASTRRCQSGLTRDPSVRRWPSCKHRVRLPAARHEGVQQAASAGAR